MSSSTFFPPAPTLTHSVNSSGRMGAFVDSSRCSCQGCATYRLQTLDFPLWDAADAHLFVAPAPEPAPAPAPAPAEVQPEPVLPVRSVGGGLMALGRAPANQIWDGDQWVHTDSEAGRALIGLPSEPVALGPSPTPPSGMSESQFLKYSRSGALGLGLGLSMGQALLGSGPVAPPLDEEERVMDALRGLRATLQIRQDAVYSTETRSHDEMAAQDAEWDELDRKIDAIEQTLLAFGSFFRTR